MKQEPLTLRRWTRREYERVVDLGVFHEDPVELVGGHLVVAEPKGAYHVTGVGLVEDALRSAFGPGWIVRVQAPVALDDESEPEPDVAVVPGTWRDYRAAHPSLPVLAVEVAETSLAFDRAQKSSLYARGGIADYWIVNLIDRVLEVHREPIQDASAPYGWRYRSVQTLGPTARVAPLAMPSARIPVTSLLP